MKVQFLLEPWEKKQMNKVKFALLVIIAFSSFSCGGGGGGGGGSSKGVRVFHAAVSVPPVDFFSSSSEEAEIENIQFSFASERRNLGEGPQSLRLVRTILGGQTYVNLNRTLESDESYTLILFGNRESLGINGNLISDVRPEREDKGNVLIRVVHGTDRAASVNLSANGRVLGSASFGDASSYFEIPSGVTSVSVSRVADSKVLATQSIDLNSGSAYSVFASGSAASVSIVRVVKD